MKTILILAYYSFDDPVFQSAVLPYFTNFPDKEIKFVLVTYENYSPHKLKYDIDKVKMKLRFQNIVWVRMTYRSGSFKPIKKILNLFESLIMITYWIRRYRVNAIYSEGFPGAILGFYVSLLNMKGHLIHSFEPHADYMVEAKVWKSNSFDANILKWHERKIAKHATYIFTGTNLMIDKLSNEGVGEEVLFRVPSCVDIKRFYYDNNERIKIRSKYCIEENELVIVYLGKFGGMYMDDEVFEFFEVCNKVGKFRFLVISTDNEDKIRALASAYELNEKLIIVRLEPFEINKYLSAADFGFVAVRQYSSKKFCSPIKTGEYLSCGLPIIIPEGISDDHRLLHSNGLAIILKDTAQTSYLEVAKEMVLWSKRPNLNEVRKRARSYVEMDRDVENYQRLYAKLFKTL